MLAWMRALHRVNLSETLDLADRNIAVARASGEGRIRDLLPSLLDTRARVLLELGRVAEAEQAEREAIRLAQQNGQTDACMEIQLGLILTRANKPEEAAQVWRAAEARLTDANVRGVSEAICPETFTGPFGIRFTGY
jgi:tetratricopeptide (TPR) repeat protein